MANNTRIYVVSEHADPADAVGVVKRMVRASTPAQAIRHVVAPRFTAEVATTDDAVTLASNGVKVEDAAE